MATDVAFALAALAALGSRVPSALIAFLLGVAVIDDIVAILVVAVYYTDTVALSWLAAALCGLAAIYALQRLGIRYLGVYIVLGFLIWFATLESGVHATIAGVALGLLTPIRPFQEPRAVSVEAIRTAEATDAPDDPDADAAKWRRLSWLSREAISPLERVEHGLHPWSSFVVLPIFPLANAGIVLDGGSLRAAVETPVALAVALGLVVGKTLGLTSGTALAVRLGLSSLPAGVRWAHVVGVGASGEDSEKKLRRAGANRIISPYKASGSEMARAARHPQVAGVHAAPEYRLEEIEVQSGCEGDGRRIEDIRGTSIIVALRSPDGSFQPQPPGGVILKPGDVLVAMGTSATMDRLEGLFAPAAATTRPAAS